VLVCVERSHRAQKTYPRLPRKPSQRAPLKAVKLHFVFQVRGAEWLDREAHVPDGSMIRSVLRDSQEVPYSPRKPEPLRTFLASSD